MRVPAILLSLLLLGSFTTTAIAHVDPAPLDLESCSLTGARDAHGMQILVLPLALGVVTLVIGRGLVQREEPVLAPTVVPRSLAPHPCIQC